MDFPVPEIIKAHEVIKTHFVQEAKRGDPCPQHYDSPQALSPSVPHHACCSAPVPCFCLQHCTKPLHTSWRPEQGDDCSLQLLNGTCSQSQADKAKEGEEVASCIAAETRILERDCFFRPLSNVWKEGKEADKNMHGKHGWQHTGHRPWETKPRPSQFPAFCHLQTPGPLQSACPCIIALQTPFVVLWLGDFPDGLEPPHIMLGGKI